MRLKNFYYEIHELAHQSRTSLYTILRVHPKGAVLPFSKSSRTMHTRRLAFVVTRNRATYNCPCVKQGVGKYTPTWRIVWPWDLLMVIVKAGRIGNCLRFIVKGRSRLDGDRVMRGIKTRIPTKVPIIISASDMWAKISTNQSCAIAQPFFRINVS